MTITKRRRRRKRRILSRYSKLRKRVSFIGKTLDYQTYLSFWHGNYEVSQNLQGVSMTTANFLQNINDIIPDFKSGGNFTSATVNLGGTRYINENLGKLKGNKVRVKYVYSHFTIQYDPSGTTFSGNQVQKIRCRLCLFYYKDGSYHAPVINYNGNTSSTDSGIHYFMLPNFAQFPTLVDTSYYYPTQIEKDAAARGMRKIRDYTFWVDPTQPIREFKFYLMRGRILHYAAHDLDNTSEMNILNLEKIGACLLIDWPLDTISKTDTGINSIHLTIDSKMVYYDQ